MSTRAVSNGDTVLVQKSTIFGTLTIAKFRPNDNVLEMVDGCSRSPYLEVALSTIRKYQRGRNLPVAPVRVEYW